ncbi:hypothetical protein OAF63_06390 [Saprospiraceae bacterium]|nr:hypothetical protein [Bacteroidota bacterium]MDB4728402.1 hypothetical protein [Saprospiraceae bacterium]
MKKYIIGTLAGGLTLFLAGVLIYALLLPNPEFANGPAAEAAIKSSPNVISIVMGELVLGFLLTYIFHKWASISTVSGGAKAGALIGGLIALGFNLLVFGTTELMTVEGYFYNAFTWVIRWALAGAVVGLILGKVKD